MGIPRPTVESLDVNLFGGTYRGRRVLVTGHTGFKGSWLSLWLTQLGAAVAGLSLPPNQPSHWTSLGLAIEERLGDLRDAAVARACIESVQPEMVFHLAAQSLVRASYDDPLATWSTNVMATANVLDACRHVGSVRAVVVVTSDKCYENREWPWGYREIDPLGGHDPYSASKAATELVAASYRRAFFAVTGGPLLATTRAGNVIGGGDWAADRLVPDAMRAAMAHATLTVRAPDARRPWQHVLDCLAGYLTLGARLLEGDAACAEAWNFGPVAADNWPVRDVLAAIATRWPEVRWQPANAPERHEASLLLLDTAKARAKLRWRPVWDLATAVAHTTDWYLAFNQGQVTSGRQLDAYVEAARAAGMHWATA